MNQQNNKVTNFISSESFRNLSESEEIEKVFGIDLIFEKILALLIFNKNLTINRKVVQTVRLVNKHWLNTTSTLLKRWAKPLFVITTDEASGEKNEIPLNQIHEILTSSERLFSSLLPFKLILTHDYFLEKNHQSLKRFLTRLGSELIELKIRFPEDGGTMSLVFPKFNLPQLQKISFETKCCFNGWKNNNDFIFLQQILSSTKNLRDLVFPLTLNKLSDNFESLNIPDTLLSVQFHNPLDTKHLDILLRNKIPNLNHLTLKMPRNPTEDEMMCKILKRFQSSLISLEVNGKHHCSSDKIIIKFPKLEKLQKLQIIGSQYEFEHQTASDLKALLPKIKSIELTHQTEATLANWTRNSKLTLIESLRISVIQCNPNDPDFFKSIKMDTLIQLHTTFPNITTLVITVNVKDTSCLMYLFQNMTRLKSLRINIQNDVVKAYQCNYESVLMGLPVWLVSAHEEQSEYFQSFIRKRGRKPCLINLSELTSFTMWVHTVPHTDEPARQTAQRRPRVLPMFSDLLFTQVFFKTPKLRTIILSQNIQPTEEMEEKWKANGRFIEYITMKD